ncbi:heavy metal-associated domain-containing protein [Massilia sp. CF038]|uniref:heavy-metal-associated domain-containing protein n=1 Tax=Massilia sp. CF038 TaxID=1881045 RepID=UPI0009209D73|nr:heavy metal-associated domain-containing protein [Massilia sp. CF038]SHG64194.1 hypothetical protein SAMN05428948_1407 [Massilia sp. CF038]
MHAQALVLPVRLELRFALLQNNPARLAMVSDALRGLDGIEAVDVSVATGAMQIQYDGSVGNQHRFWDNVEAVLEAHHLYHDQRAAPRTHRFAGLPVRQMVKRSALKLVAGWR